MDLGMMRPPLRLKCTWLCAACVCMLALACICCPWASAEVLVLNARYAGRRPVTRWVDLGKDAATVTAKSHLPFAEPMSPGIIWLGRDCKGTAAYVRLDRGFGRSASGAAQLVSQKDSHSVHSTGHHHSCLGYGAPRLCSRSVPDTSPAPMGCPDMNLRDALTGCRRATSRLTRGPRGRLRWRR